MLLEAGGIAAHFSGKFPSGVKRICGPPAQGQRVYVRVCLTRHVSATSGRAEAHFQGQSKHASLTHQKQREQRARTRLVLALGSPTQTFGRSLESHPFSQALSSMFMDGATRGATSGYGKA